MTQTNSKQTLVCTRRDVLKVGGTMAAASALAGMAVPPVHAAEDNTIRLALIGSGNRGSGAVGNAIGAAAGRPIKLVAMADILEPRLQASHKALSGRFGDKIDVPPERQFVGFDAYRQVMDSDVDVVVSFDGPATSSRYFGVQFYLEDLLHTPVDLVTEKAMRPELRSYIEREAIDV